MLLSSSYKEWVLPVLLKNSAWNEFIDAILDEIVTLQMYNMGSCNLWGFSGAEEDIDFTDINDWELCSLYDASRGSYTLGGSFTIVTDYLAFTSSGGVDSYAVKTYSFVSDRYYKVKFKVTNIEASGDTILRICLGEMDIQTITIDVATEENTEFELMLLASDYYLSFGVLTGENLASFRIEDLEIVGILDEEDEKERFLILRKAMSVDNASVDILDLMRDSLTFPKIEGMPEALIRRVLKDYDTFIGYVGSEMASIMMFYFMGYAADFVSLYAHKDDYEARQYSYLSEKESDTLTSVGVAETDQYATYRIQLKEGHQVIPGDLLMNDTNPFSAIRVEVSAVDGVYVDLVSKVTVYDEDVLDVFRLYKYAVNPDPSNYFKTSHIDVFFSRRYTAGEDIDFAKLEEFFTQYLPINVVIRFFGYKTEIPDEEFSIIETLITTNTKKTELITFTESLTFPISAFAHVVQNPLPFTHIDIYGNEVDGYSYIASHIDPGSGEPVLMIVPLT